MKLPPTSIFRDDSNRLPAWSVPWLGVTPFFSLADPAPISPLVPPALGWMILLATIAGGIWLYLSLLKQSADPRRILVKTALTLVVLVIACLIIPLIMRIENPFIGAFCGVGSVAATGIMVGLIWCEYLARPLARPFENLFTGGSEPPDPAPVLSIARAKLQQQLFDEAIRELEGQLERYPNDFGCLMFMAEIQALNQHNLSGAAETIERLCAAHADTPRRVARALTALADWQLQSSPDRGAARALFERIRVSFPDHPVAIDAAQRLAHLPPVESTR